MYIGQCPELLHRLFDQIELKFDQAVEQFVRIVIVQILEDFVDGEEDLPEDTLDEGGDDVDDGDVAEAEEERDVPEVLRRSPAVVEGDHRPACLCEYLHHDVHALGEGGEAAELDVLVVGGHALGGVEVVEDLHAEDDVDVEEEGEEVHELQDDREDLQHNREDVPQLHPHLQLHVPQVVAVRD